MLEDNADDTITDLQFRVLIISNTILAEKHEDTGGPSGAAKCVANLGPSNSSSSSRCAKKLALIAERRLHYEA
ncbi:hypothetical protein V9T40_013214 [Parthenolecanium corni]|uniref:Uncharacterized protein n=1 Tax=Parthenolecanium corni TaxID=536013 RepID=A0AAN9TWT6_9HEMI